MSIRKLRDLKKERRANREEARLRERKHRDNAKLTDAEMAVKVGRVADALNVGRFRRHMFLCLGPDCCRPEVGEASWAYLKARLKELGLVDGAVYRTKVGCFRICNGGPIAVVYPE